MKVSHVDEDMVEPSNTVSVNLIGVLKPYLGLNLINPGLVDPYYLDSQEVKFL